MLCLLLACPSFVLAAQEETPVFSSMKQVAEYVFECAGNLDETIEFGYTSGLAAAILEYEDWYQLFYSSGMVEWQKSNDSGKRLFRIENIRYSTANRILYVFNTGHMELWTEEEFEVLYWALQIANRAKLEGGSDWEKALWIHDELCRIITYELGVQGGGVTANDMALGALLYRKAECDGYADAFYLAARFAGLNAERITGTAGDSPLTAGGHMWNAIELDGRWYHIDLVWDDPNYADTPDMVRYRMFCVGSDLAGGHYWSDDSLPYDMAACTDWDKFYYTCDQSNLKKGYGLYVADAENAAVHVANEYSAGAGRAHVMIQQRGYTTEQLHEAMNKYMPSRSSWTTWRTETGGYTLFDVYFFR